MPKAHKDKQARINFELRRNPGGRWVSVKGNLKGCGPRVQILVWSQDGRWHGQRPLMLEANGGRFECNIAIGNDTPSGKGNRYFAVAYVGEKLPPYAVLSGLDSLPEGIFSNQIEMLRY
jgi:hypothetical protein